MRVRRYMTVFAMAAALTAAGCSSSTGTASPKGATGSAKPGGTLTFALDQDIAGFNPLREGDTQFVLAEMQDQVLPRVFVIQPNLQSALNTEFVTSASVTSNSPQTIVYHINPKAVWSDGTPISADDFIYSWQAQSGNPAFTDVGGAKFLPASTGGYNRIQSVTGSDGGKTVTVVMAEPYSEWQYLFSQTNPIIPAHIAKQVG